MLQHLFIALKNLDRIPTLLFGWHAVHRSLLNMGNGVLHRAAEAMLRHGFRALRSTDGLLGRLHDARALQRGNFYHLAPQLAGKLVNIDFVAALVYNIHHIDGHNHRDAELRELRGQI